MYACVGVSLCTHVRASIHPPLHKQRQADHIIDLTNERTNQPTSQPCTDQPGNRGDQRVHECRQLDFARAGVGSRSGCPQLASERLRAPPGLHWCGELVGRSMSVLLCLAPMVVDGRHPFVRQAGDRQEVWRSPCVRSFGRSVVRLSFHSRSFILPSDN